MNSRQVPGARFVSIASEKLSRVILLHDDESCRHHPSTLPDVLQTLSQASLASSPCIILVPGISLCALITAVMEFLLVVKVERKARDGEKLAHNFA